MVVLNQSPLRALVVVGGDDQQRVNAQRLGGQTVLNDLFGVVAARARQHRNPPADRLHREADDLSLLLGGHGCRLARRAADEDGVRMVVDLVLEQIFQRGVIDLSLLKGRDERHAAPREYGIHD